MQSLTQYLVEAVTAKDFGNKEVVPEFEIEKHGNLAPICKVTYKEENGYKLVYLQIDYWNNTLICRVGKTHEDKWAVAVFKIDNKDGVDLGKSRAAVPWMNGYKYDPVRMGGKVQYTFDDKEYKEVMDAFKNKDKDLFDKIENTLKTLEEYN